MKILGISGSPRLRGNSAAILEAALEGAASLGAEVEAAHLSQYRIEPCVGCEKCRKDKICTKFQDGMQLLYPKIMESDGLILVSPVHNYNLTAWMKAFIDRLYCFYDFTDDHPRGWSSRLAEKPRAAAVACVGEQLDMHDLGITLPALRMPIEPMGYRVVGELPVLGMFQPGKVRSAEDVLEQARKLGSDVVEALR